MGNYNSINDAVRAKIDELVEEKGLDKKDYLYTADVASSLNQLANIMGGSGDSMTIADALYDVLDSADGAGDGGSGGDFAGLVDGTITQAHDSTVTSVRGGVFNGLSNLTEVIFPECKSVDYYAFSGCNQLSKVSFPECTTIEAGAFAGCAIKEAIFPKCVSLGMTAIDCETLENAFLPALPSLVSSTFQYCTNLNTVVLQNCSYIGKDCFFSCVSLESLYMLGSSRVTLDWNNTYHYEPLRDSKIPTTGHIYVPASLMDSYKTAEYWSNYSSRFEGLTDEEITEILGE